MVFRFVSKPLFAVLISGLAMVACSSDDDRDSAQPTESAHNLFADLLRKADDGQYQVVYEWIGADGTTNRYTVAVKAGKTYVGQASIKGSAEDESKTVVIDDGATMFHCDEFGGLLLNQPDDALACLATPSAGRERFASPFELFPTRIADHLAYVNAFKDRQGTESVAGRTAACFPFEERDGIGSGRVCFDEKLGVPLILDATESAGKSVSIRAADVSEQVDDAIFQPPYPVR